MPTQHRPRPPHSVALDADLALQVEAVEVAAQAAMMRADLAGRLVPAGVTRPLFPHELAAATNFAAIDAAVIDTAGQLTDRLTAARRRLLELIGDDLAAQPTLDQAMRRLAALRTDGLATLIPDAAALIDTVEGDAADLLAEHALASAERARLEAIAQGVDALPPGTIAPDVFERIDDAARRLATGPPADLLRTLQEEAFVRRAAVTTPADLAAELRALGANLSPAPLEAYASSAAASVDGLARQAEADRIGTPAAVYASELLDRNTCAPCSLVDGHQFDTVDEARAEYPGGTYRNCAGGPRCRGTLVFVWAETEPGQGGAPNPPLPEPPTPPPAPAPVPPSPLPDPLAPGVDPADVEIARANLAAIRAELRGQAAAVADNAAGYFEPADAYHLARPKRRLGGAPGKEGRRQQAANYDWYDALHPNEKKRLLRRWMPEGDYSSPDELVTDLTRVYRYQSEQDALDAWLEQTRRYDAASSLARGKLPPLDAYGGADINALVDSPYDLRIVFGTDLDDAALHIATSDAGMAEEYAARIFRPVRPGFTPPYQLSEAEYVDEVTALEARAHSIEPLTDDPDFGPTFAPDDQAVIDRLDELIPNGLDDPTDPRPANELYQLLIDTARRARLIR